MRGNPIYVGSSFSGGLNTRDAAYEVGLDQARDLLNVTGVISGAVRKRDGLVTFSSPPVQLNSLFAVEATTTRWLLGQGGSAFYKIDTGGAVTAITGSTVPSSARWSMAQAPAIGGQGPVFLSNGVDAPQQWSGSGNLTDWTATAGALPNGKFLMAAGNRVFAAGMSSYGSVSDPGSALVWSDIGNPRSWPSQNVVLLDPNDGDQITGIGTFGPNVIVFKRRKTFVVYNLDTGANRRISADTGCAAARSVVETPNGTYFLTLDKGVYITNGSSMQPVSDAIHPTLDAINESQRVNAAGEFFNSHYYLAVALGSGATANDTLLDYDTLQRSWWLHSVASSDLAVWRPVGNAELHSANSGVARTSRCFVAGQASDNGAAFEAHWTSGWLSPSYFRRRIINSPDMRKRLRGVRFDASGAFSLYIARDFAGGGNAFQHVADYDYTGATTYFGGTSVFGGGGIFGGPASTSQGRAANLGVQRSFSLRFYSDSTKPWELENYVVIMGERAD